MPRNVIVKSISFNPEELAELDRMAEEEGRNRSQQISQLIRKAKKAQAAEKAPV